MLAKAECLIDQIRRRADLHVITRPKRWRHLGFNVPTEPVRAISWAASHIAPTLPLVSIILATHRVDRIQQCRQKIVSQDYPHLEVIVVLNNDAFDEACVRETFSNTDRLQVLRLPEARNLGSCINLGVANAAGAYIAKMDDDDFYGPSYISDLLLSALESGADITGKKAIFFYFEDGGELCFWYPELRNQWMWPASAEKARTVRRAMSSTKLVGGTLLMKSEVVRQIPFDEVAPRGTDGIFQLACRRAGMTAYASDEFNYCYMRCAGNEGHLWQTSKDRILGNGVLLQPFDHSQICV